MATKDREDERLPTIPDGGLASSMPDWLQRPPAWRTVDDDEPTDLTHDRSDALPQAETSTIDPRTFLTEDDLPPWLRGLHRPAGLGQEVAGGHKREADGPDVATTAGTSSRFVPRSITPASQARGESGVRKESPGRGRSGPAPSRLWARWQGLQLVLLLLAGALFVALLAIVILLI